MDKFKYEIDENIIHNKSGRKVSVDHYEIQKFEGFLYTIYCCHDEYGFQVKGHAIDFEKEK
jgi:hypothetical protein